MSMTAPALIQSSNHRVLESSVRDFISLMKPGVMSLVVFTGLSGMLLAPGHLNPLQQFITLLCIALGSGAGAAMNMWYDRDIDAIMTRTKKRPIPAGRIAPDDALAFGLFLAAFSVMLMGLGTNWLAALILAFAIFFYVVVYTMWLKRRTPQNIVIGGAAGAFPPMIGWAAVTGGVSLMPLLLFVIIFLWTPPHFWALALYKNEDYTRAGVPMMPVVAGSDSTKRQMMFYTWLLTAVTLLPPLLHLAGAPYAVVAALLDVTFLHHMRKVLHDATDTWPRKAFAFSIYYLFMLFVAMVLDGWWTHAMQ
ncbi:MAG: heme o synthase [Pseudomonadota bacterium]|nr:heme o synthase [Pseudomonadota bacterium]MDE3037392.1 heme o synthase [Pseudomonadota bacterium]